MTQTKVDAKKSFTVFVLKFPVDLNDMKFCDLINLCGGLVNKKQDYAIHFTESKEIELHLLDCSLELLFEITKRFSLSKGRFYRLLDPIGKINQNAEPYDFYDTCNNGENSEENIKSFLVENFLRRFLEWGAKPFLSIMQKAEESGFTFDQIYDLALLRRMGLYRFNSMGKAYWSLTETDPDFPGIRADPFFIS